MNWVFHSTKMIKIMFLFFILLTILWKGIESVDLCSWMATQLDLSPPREDLTNHVNWHLLPVGKCGKLHIPKISQRIYGGVEVRNPYDYPWMAKTSFFGKGKGKINCGGSIISERYILTAAHCCTRIQRFSKNKGVWFLGSQYIYLSDRTIEIEKILVYPYFMKCKDTGFLKHDICLVRLKEKIQFKANIQPICLPIKYGREVQEGETLVVAGWGIIHSNWNQPTELMAKTVKALSQDQCRRYISPAVDAREICTTSGACDGDSGGPLMKWFSKNYIKTYYQYGVVSTGSIDCQDNNTVYPRVTEYMDWIVKNLRA